MNRIRSVNTYEMCHEMGRFLMYATMHSYSPWYLQHGPLRHGLTLWLNSEEGISSAHNGEFEHCQKFIRDFALENVRHLCRAYIHRLRPGEKIDRHADVEPYHYTVDRFQLYLNWPFGCGMTLGGVSHTFSGGDLVDFDLTQQHEYWNSSLENWYFMVLDLKK